MNVCIVDAQEVFYGVQSRTLMGSSPFEGILAQVTGSGRHEEKAQCCPFGKVVYTPFSNATVW